MFFSFRKARENKQNVLVKISFSMSDRFRFAFI